MCPDYVKYDGAFVLIGMETGTMRQGFRFMVKHVHLQQPALRRGVAPVRVSGAKCSAARVTLPGGNDAQAAVCRRMSGGFGLMHATVNVSTESEEGSICLQALSIE